MRIIYLIKRVIRCQRGIAFTEFALTVPLLLLLSLGGVEVTRYIILHQKLDKVAFSMADLVAQSHGISTSEVDMIFTAVDNLVQPFSFGSDGVVIVTSIGNHNNNGVRVNWQRSGAGTLSANSSLGSPGDLATVPSGLTVSDKEDVIFAEVYYQFTPLLLPQLFPATIVYKRVAYKPRLGELDTIEQS